MGDKSELKKKDYERELERLQDQLVELQDWIKHTGERIVVVFEGRDAAGKGGIIKRILGPMNPRTCRVVALPKPTEREQSQWYFQRYVAHLPAAGEIVLFDRSWYNRAGVERVMGFATEEQVERFFQQVNRFEDMLVQSGIRVIKYWLDISADEQLARFRDRLEDPSKRWKFSPMDLKARSRWVDYTRARDDMLLRTHSRAAPWHVVDANDKKRARLNCITHLLSMVAHEDLPDPPIELPELQNANGYDPRPFDPSQRIPQRF